MKRFGTTGEDFFIRSSLAFVSRVVSGCCAGRLNGKEREPFLRGIYEEIMKIVIAFPEER